MPMIKRPVIPTQIDYVCDKCGEGKYRPTGVTLMSNPPKFPHTCTLCGDTHTFYKIYPCLEYEEIINE